jgi:hypothetical protein
MIRVHMKQQKCSIAALQGASSVNIQAFLGDFAMRLAREGYKIPGAIEIVAAESMSVCRQLAMRNLSTGGITSISQNLGPGSTACNLDPSGLAETCAAVERAIAAGADLVIFSKFGKQEAGRGGMSDAFRAAIAAGLPVLTSVSPAMSDAWRAFAGPLSQFLPLDPEVVDTWWLDTNCVSQELVDGRCTQPDFRDTGLCDLSGTKRWRRGIDGLWRTACRAVQINGKTVADHSRAARCGTYRLS